MSLANLLTLPVMYGVDFRAALYGGGYKNGGGPRVEDIIWRREDQDLSRLPGDKNVDGLSKWKVECIILPSSRPLEGPLSEIV